MGISNEQYSTLVQERVYRETGIQADTWAMCTATNATYTDCPITPDFDGDFVVAAHNPASVTQHILRFKLPPTNGYSAEVFDSETQEWSAADSTLICFDYQENAVSEGTT